MLSRRRFEQDARGLLEALKTVLGEKAAGDDRDVSRAFILDSWKLEGDDCEGVFYLSHPPITTVTQQEGLLQLLVENDGARPSTPVDDDLDEDDTIFVDTAQVRVADIHDDRPVTSDTITWNFSIVYSETYQVPVLYFHAQHTFSGEPCSRAQVLKYLSPGVTASNDSWEFVSQEPHPQTGFPSYFLHPCRTAVRMKLLRHDHEKNGDDHNNPNYLWVWMSMIFPTVGHAIPPAFYQTIHDTLCGI